MLTSEFQEEKKAARRAALREEKEAKIEREKAKELMSYKSIFRSAEGMVSNVEVQSSTTNEAAMEFEDDFM